MPPNRITAILNDEGGITGDTAIRLGTFSKYRGILAEIENDLGSAEHREGAAGKGKKHIEENRTALFVRRNAKDKDLTPSPELFL